MKLVSVVLTTHMRPRAIVERALNSVLAQTYKCIEIILVDDSPADYPQRESIRKLAEERGVQYIPHERCQGACVARNTGTAAAKGELIAFLDDDDEWNPTKIQKQVQVFTDETGLVYCGSETLQEATGTVQTEKTVYKNGMVYDQLICDNFIGSTSFPLLRKASLEEVGGFDPLMRSAQDYDTWLRIAQRYPVGYVAEPLARYHLHSGERISSDYSKKIAGLERLNEKNMPYLQKHKRVYAMRLYKLVPYYGANGQMKKALSTWMKAVSFCPWQLNNALRYFRRLWKTRKPMAKDKKE